MDKSSKEKRKLFIDGEWVSTASELEVKNPYDGSTVAVTYLAGEAEMESAVESSAMAFEPLRKLPAFKRSEMLAAVAAGIEERADEIARTIALEAGKAIKEARGEVKRAAQTFIIASEEAKRLTGEVIPLDVSEGGQGRLGMLRRFPVGPVLGITPFNFPLNLVAHKVAPAMACGCPIIIKPASKTPLTALILAEIAEAAGYPPGALNVVAASGSLAGAAAEDERIKKITFTGSPPVGWGLKQRAPKKKVTLELGGNAGVIVCADADIEYAVNRCVLGSFAYAGQVCISVQRIFVERGVFDEFTEAFVGAASKLKLGDPLDDSTDIGPMIDEASLEATENLVNEAVEGGARLLTGGERIDNVFKPTVLSSTTTEMKACKEEAFAPIVVIEPFDDFASAIRAIDDSQYGLQAGVFTRDIKRAFSAYEDIEVGGLIIGDVPTFRVDNMPYGGVKNSGFGREGVKYAIEEMSEPRLMVFNNS